MPELIAPAGYALHVAQPRPAGLLDVFSPSSNAGTHTPITFATGMSTPRADSPALDAPAAHHANRHCNPPTPPESPTGSTCIVCMDQPKDIALAPCGHAHCCLVCFRRSKMRACPICRTRVDTIVVLSSGMQLPVSLVSPKPIRERSGHTRSSGNLRESVLYEMPRNFHDRQSMPSLSSSLDYEPFSSRIRTMSMSSVGVARQAEFSVRSLSRSQDAVFRRLRETGSVQTDEYLPVQVVTNPERRNIISSATSSVSTQSPESQAQVGSEDRRQNMVLIGHSRKMLVALAQRLMATFPPTGDRDNFSRSKSTVYINGQAIGLVLIECPIFSMGPELVARIQRQSPKLVLLCADFFNVSSFESIVRLDMEMLDYLNIACTWVLVKSTSVRKKKTSNIVEEADVRTAQHFLSKPRRCFVAPVDGPLQTSTMRTLGLYIYRSVCHSDTSAPLPPTLENKPRIMPPRSFSLFCIRPNKPAKRMLPRRRASKSTSNLARWLF